MARLSQTGAGAATSSSSRQPQAARKSVASKASAKGKGKAVSDDGRKSSSSNSSAEDEEEEEMENQTFAFTVPSIKQHKSRTSSTKRKSSLKPASSTASRAPAKVDLKGKGRAIEQDDADPAQEEDASRTNIDAKPTSTHERRRSDDRNAPPGRYLELLMSEPGNTPARSNGYTRTSTPRVPALPSSQTAAVTKKQQQQQQQSQGSTRTRARTRTRTASIAPPGSTSVPFSAMKPVKLKSIIRSSPARYVISSDEDEAEDGNARRSRGKNEESDDDLLLKSRDLSDSSEYTAGIGLTHSGEKEVDIKPRRRTRVGEYEWDERSRSCIPRRVRERERSRSMALTLKAEQREDGDIFTDAADPETDADADASGAGALASTSNILGGLLQRDSSLDAEEAKDAAGPALLNDQYAMDQDADIPVPYDDELPPMDQGDMLDLPPMPIPMPELEVDVEPEDVQAPPEPMFFDYTNGGGQESDDDDGDDVEQQQQQQQQRQQQQDRALQGGLPTSEPTEAHVKRERRSSPFSDGFEKSIRRVVTMEAEVEEVQMSLERERIMPEMEAQEDPEGNGRIEQQAHINAPGLVRASDDAVVNALEREELEDMSIEHQEEQIAIVDQAMAQVPLVQAAKASIAGQGALPSPNMIEGPVLPIQPCRRQSSELPPSSPPPLPPAPSRPSAAGEEAISMDTDSEDEVGAFAVSSAAKSGTWRADLVARLASPGSRQSHAIVGQQGRLRVPVTPQLEEEQVIERDRIVPICSSRSPSVAPPVYAEGEQHAVERLRSQSPTMAIINGTRRSLTPVPKSQQARQTSLLSSPALSSHARDIEDQSAFQQGDIMRNRSASLAPPPAEAAQSTRLRSATPLLEPSAYANKRRSLTPTVASQRSQTPQPGLSPARALLHPIGEKAGSVTPLKRARTRSPSPFAPEEPNRLLSPSARRVQEGMEFSARQRSRTPIAHSPTARRERDATPIASASLLQNVLKSPGLVLPPANDTLGPAAPEDLILQQRNSSAQPATPQGKQRAGSPEKAPGTASLAERLKSVSPALRSPAPTMQLADLPMQSTPARAFQRPGATPSLSPGGAFLPRSLHQMLEMQSPQRQTVSRQPTTPPARDPLRSPGTARGSRDPTTPLLERIRALRSASIASPRKALVMPEEKTIKEEEREETIHMHFVGSTVPSAFDTALQPAFDFTDATPEEHIIARQISEEGEVVPALVHGVDTATQPDAPEDVMKAPAAAEQAPSSSDSEAEAEEVARSLTRSPSIAKSPAPASARRSPFASPGKRPLMDLDEDAPLSPNVTLRRGRSGSRSSAGKSKPATPAQPPRSAAKRSFAELNFDSSPMSVAASISHKSFEALDTSSEDEEEGDGETAAVARPSPSKQIAAAQLAQQQQQMLLLQREKQHRYDSLVSSSDDEDDMNPQAHQSPLRSALNSSPGHVKRGSNLFSNVLNHITTSTPAKLLGAMALRSGKHLQSPEAQAPQPLVEPASPEAQPSPQLRSPPNASTPATAAVTAEPVAAAEKPVPAAKESVLSETRATPDLVDASLFVEPATPGIPSMPRQLSSEPSDAVFDYSAYSAIASDVAAIGDGSTFLEGLSSADMSVDTSAILDDARPRSDLVAPQLVRSARPMPARARSARSKIPIPSSGKKIATKAASILIATTAPTSSPVVSRTRSVSGQPSVTSSSNGSGIVQVSSVDPKMAARAAAILKVHHRYIHDGAVPESASVAATASAQDGEAVLDELLKEAEMEISMRNATPAPKAEEGSPSRIADTTVVTHQHSFANTSQWTGNLSARRVVRQHPVTRLGVWTRKDWRALEQCFIDERRRTVQTRRKLRVVDVVQTYLDSEDMVPAQCIGEWHIDKLEARVQALMQRKQQKGSGDSFSRERSVSCVSTVPSRAPSDFFKKEESRITAKASERHFTVPSPNKSKLGRRAVQSAEPSYPPTPRTNNNDSHFLRPKQTNTTTSTRASAIQRSSSLDNPSAFHTLKTAPSFATNQPGSLYPSLTELEHSMRPLKHLPIRGQKIAAVIGKFEQLGGDRVPITFGPSQKRKAMSEEPASVVASKRQRV